MGETRLTHISINADDVEESTRFYTEVFGLEPIPTPDYGDPIQWLRCGEVHIHLVTKGVEAPDFHHFALHVDDFEGVYEAVEAFASARFDCLGDPAEQFDADGNPPVYRTKGGTLQLYVRDPSGNKVEINHPDDGVDRSVARHLVDRHEVAEPPEDRGEVRMYTEELLAEVGRS